MSRVGPLESLAPGSLFSEYFGADYGKVEADLIAHLKSLPYVDPIANQTHFVLMMGGPQREVVVTSSPLKLQEVQCAQPQGRPIHVQAFPNRDAATLFARRWLETP